MMGRGARDFDQAQTFHSSRILPEAIRAYCEAEREGFEMDRCASGRWACYMLAGEWELAWRESDAIAARGAPDPHRFWDGSDWSGKDVLVRCLHGLGDTLQFIRFAALLRKRARSVTVESQPDLKILLSASDIADRVITWGEAEPPWQVQMEVNELPRIFRVTPGSIPATVPYLLARSSIVAGTMLRVGLIWSGSDFDTARNVPLQLLLPRLQIPGIQIYSLQGGVFPSPLPEHLVDLIGSGIGIEQVADHMAGLDLILTVDTMAAHLAGAMGRPVWTMLRFQCDWRWMTQRTDTPWYSTMRLFRQQREGDWAGVISEVYAALLHWRDSGLHG